MNLISIIWLGSVFFLILYYTVFYIKLLLQKGDQPSVRYEGGVSVLICALNEAGNLRRNLPAILSQDYEDFEVVVIDDNSTDDTEGLIRSLQSDHPNLKYFAYRESKNYRGKKKALAYGLSKIIFPKVLLTDADCRPLSSKWIRFMSAHFSEKDIVLGFAPLMREGGWINRLQRWETFQTALQYFSFANLGIPYMGVGRNLGYSKEIFDRSDKFTSHFHIPSGDDDLFISSVADENNTGVEWRPETFVYSKGMQTFGRWWRQKRRHLSTGPHYPRLSKFLLGLYGLAQLIFYLLTPLVFVFENGAFFGCALLGKMLLQYITFGILSRRFRSIDTILLMPVWEFITVISQSLIHLQNQLQGTAKNWK